MGETDLVVGEVVPAAGVPMNPQAENPTSMLAMAVSSGLDPEIIRGFMDLKDRDDKAISERAYTEAMTEFKADPPVIDKDKDNKQYGSKYSSLENMVNKAIPKLSEHGFSHKWKIDQSGGSIKVTCFLTHKMGHSDSCSLEAPPDNSGKKNDIQQIKSTITYLKSATFESVTGLASAEVNLSDDGNAYGEQLIDKNQTADIELLIKENNRDRAGFLTHFKIEDVSDLPASEYKKAVNLLKTKRQAK